MTACSVHPGTLAGAELKRLLAAHDELAVVLEPVIDSFVVSLQITRDELESLLAVEAGVVVGGPLAVHEARGWVEQSAAGEPRLTTAGIHVLAEFGRRQAELLDGLGELTDLATLRSGDFGADELERLLQRLD
jgi:hypothetical protein